MFEPLFINGKKIKKIKPLLYKAQVSNEWVKQTKNISIQLFFFSNEFFIDDSMIFH